MAFLPHFTAVNQQQVQVKVYKGKRQSDAAKDFQRDATNLAAQNYLPVSQSWAEGRSGCLRVVLLGFIGALIWKPAGTLTVTYSLQRPSPPQHPYPSQPILQVPPLSPELPPQTPPWPETPPGAVPDSTN